MKKVILSTPRSGSTLAIKWLLDQNNLLRTCKSDEPFWDNDPIDFLESERKLGNEYCYKVHIHHIEEHIDWFKNFYKDEEIYILRRRNLWKQFLSHLYQHENNWYLTYTLDATNLKTNPKLAKNYKNTLNLFMQWQDRLDDFNYDTIYYEDIDYNHKSVKYSSHIDYEKYFINIEDIKSYYNKLN